MATFDNDSIQRVLNGGTIEVSLQLPEAGINCGHESQFLSPVPAQMPARAIPHVIQGMESSLVGHTLPFSGWVPDNPLTRLKQDTADKLAIVNNVQVTHRLEALHQEWEREREIMSMSLALHWKQPVLPLMAGLDPCCALDALPQSFFGCVQSLASQTGVSSDVCALGLVTCLSMATQGRNRVAVEQGWYEPCIDYSIGVSYSGNQKTNLIQRLKSPFDTFINELTEIYVANQLTNRLHAKIANKAINIAENDIVKKLAKEIGKNLNRPEIIQNKIKYYVSEFESIESLKINKAMPPQLFFDNASRSQLQYKAQEMAGCVCILKDEAGTLLGVISRKCDMDFVLNAHTMMSTLYSTVSRGDVNIPTPAMPMFHLIQLTKMLQFQREADPHGDGGNGLLPRFVIAFDASVASQNQKMYNSYHEKYKNIYENKIVSLLKMYYTQDINKDIYDIQIDKAGVELCKKFRIENQQLIHSGKYRAMESFLKKAHGQAIRFSWDLHAWNNERPHEHPISLQEVRGGIQLMKLYIQHAEYFYVAKKFQTYHYAKEIFEKILTSEMPDWKERFNSRFVQQQIRGLKSSQDLTLNSLRVLAAHDIIGMNEQSGKPAICIVNKNVFKKM